MIPFSLKSILWPHLLNKDNITSQVRKPERKSVYEKFSVQIMHLTTRRGVVESSKKRTPECRRTVLYGVTLLGYCRPVLSSTVTIRLVGKCGSCI